MDPPLTSVVVPVFNDPDGLETTVRSLLDQSAEGYEVVIADNGSTDRTVRIAERFARDDRVVHVVEDDVRGSYAARNAGIEAAEGDVIGFLDADMWVERDYVESIRSAMRSDDRVYMGCDVVVVDADTPTTRFNAATGFPVRNYVEDLRFAPTCCLVVDRCVFEAVGHFDARVVSGGDVEFGHRVADAGYELAFEPDIVLYHPARATVRALVSKWFRVGRGDEQLRRYYPGRFDERSPFGWRSLLPGHPEAFADRLQIEPYSTVEFTYWFLLDWACQLSRTAGRIDQHVASRLR
jgi:glycosyltransferase involved in cell wall biosynthesis